MNYAKFLTHARNNGVEWARYIASSFGIATANIDLWASLARRDMRTTVPHPAR